VHADPAKVKGKRLDFPLQSIKINIQIRAIETVPAIGRGELAVGIVRLVSAVVADAIMFGALRLFTLGIGFDG
jgi:hypothetical protein